MVAQRERGPARIADAQVLAAHADSLHGRQECRRLSRRRRGRGGSDGSHHRHRHSYVPRSDDNGSVGRLVREEVRQTRRRQDRRRLRDAGGQFLPRHHCDAPDDCRLSRYRPRRVLGHRRPQRRRQLDAQAQDESSAGVACGPCQGALPQQRRKPRHNDAAWHTAGCRDGAVDAFPGGSQPRSRAWYPAGLLGFRQGQHEAVGSRGRGHPAARRHPRNIFPLCACTSDSAAGGDCWQRLRA